MCLLTKTPSNSAHRMPKVQPLFVRALPHCADCCCFVRALVVKEGGASPPSSPSSKVRAIATCSFECAIAVLYMYILVFLM